MALPSRFFVWAPVLGCVVAGAVVVRDRTTHAAPPPPVVAAAPASAPAAPVPVLTAPPAPMELAAPVPLLRTPYGKAALIHVLRDRQGGYVVTGAFGSRMVFSPGTPAEQVHGQSQVTGKNTAFVASFDSQQRVRWVRTIDDAWNLAPDAVVTPSGDIVALVSRPRRLYPDSTWNEEVSAMPTLIRYHADGTALWQGTFGFGLGHLAPLDGEDVLVSLTFLGALSAALPAGHAEFKVPVRTSAYGTAIFRVGPKGELRWSKLHEPLGQNAQSLSAARIPGQGLVLASGLIDGRTVVSWLDADGSPQRTRTFSIGPRSSVQPPKVFASRTGFVAVTTEFFGTLDIGPRKLEAREHDLAVTVFRPDGTLAFATTAGGPGPDLAVTRRVDVDDEGGVHIDGVTYAAFSAGGRSLDAVLDGGAQPVHLVYAADGGVRALTGEADPLAWEPACCSARDPEAEAAQLQRMMNPCVLPSGPLTADTWLAEITQGLTLGATPDAEMRGHLCSVAMKLSSTEHARGWRVPTRLPTGQRASADVVSIDGVFRRVAVYPEGDRPTRAQLEAALAPLHRHVIVPPKKVWQPYDFYCVPSAALNVFFVDDQLFALELLHRTAPCPTDAEIEHANAVNRARN